MNDVDFFIQRFDSLIRLCELIEERLEGSRSRVPDSPPGRLTGDICVSIATHLRAISAFWRQVKPILFYLNLSSLIKFVS